MTGSHDGRDKSQLCKMCSKLSISLVDYCCLWEGTKTSPCKYIIRKKKMKEILKVHTKSHNPENDTSVINATTKETKGQS